MDTQKKSQIPKYYQKSLEQRVDIVADWADLTPEQQSVLQGIGSLDVQQASNMIENVVGTYALPLGIATNFCINHRDYLVPMVIEEPSVVAAVSFAAKLFRAGWWFPNE